MFAVLSLYGEIIKPKIKISRKIFGFERFPPFSFEVSEIMLKFAE